MGVMKRMNAIRRKIEIDTCKLHGIECQLGQWTSERPEEGAESVKARL